MGNLSSMFSSSSPARWSQHPEFIQVNDSVWQLYPSAYLPPETVPTVQVVFFHGLQASNFEDAYWRTWRSRHESQYEAVAQTVVWPQAWLGPSIPGAQILSISYDSSAQKQDSYGRSSPYIITENLVSDLIDAGVGQNCPVILVGHSLGGIIIKHVILGFLVRKGRLTRGENWLEVENFLLNCKGVFYYSSQFGGSAIADWVIRGFAVMRKGVRVFALLGTLRLMGLLFKYFLLTNSDWLFVVVGFLEFLYALDAKTPRWLIQVFALLDWVVLTFSFLGLLALVETYVTLRYKLNNPIVSLLTRLSTHTAVLNREFTMAKHNLGDGGLRTRAIGESLPINLLGFNLIRVVDPASAMQDVDGGFYTAPLANHFDVCRPKNNTTDPIFTYLLEFVNDLLESNVVRPADIVEPPEEHHQLNESVWQLYAPVTVPEVDVVFIHGLREEPSNYEEAFWRTWLSRNGFEVWPRDWLSESLPEARILSISYISIAQSHPRWTDPSIIAENLIQDMIDARVGQNCPVVLVGHSLGGIIIKKIVVQCVRKKWLLDPAKYPREADRLETFVGNCQGLFFYSTPHHGSELSEYAKRIRRMNDPLITLLKTVEFLSIENALLNDEFSYAVKSRWGKIVSVGESLDTRYMGFNGKVVPEFSGRFHTNTFWRAPQVNHFNVCMPKNRDDRIFTILLDFIVEVVQSN